MSTLVRNIGELITNNRSGSYRKSGCAFTHSDGVITWVGPESEAPSDCDQVLDAMGCAVLPGFV